MLRRESRAKTYGQIAGPTAETGAWIGCPTPLDGSGSSTPAARRRPAVEAEWLGEWAERPSSRLRSKRGTYRPACGASGVVTEKTELQPRGIGRLTAEGAYGTLSETLSLS